VRQLVAEAAVGQLPARARGVSRRPTGHGPVAQVLALQRSAGNRAVCQMLQRVPKAPKVGIMDAKLIPPTAGPFEGAVSSDPYERQPADLRRVLDASHKDGELFWLMLDREERFAVTALYNRFQRFGLWKWTRRIRQIKKGTPKWCGFWVQGDTASVLFEGDGDKLFDQVLTHPKFCFDAGIGGSLHQGQHSFREISNDDSLHVSVGQEQKGHGGFQPAARDYFDAHIDRYASPSHKSGFNCEYDVVRTGQHEGREVVPGMLGKPRKGKPRVGGVEILPDDPSGTIRPELFETREDRERDKPTPVMIGWRGRFRWPWGM
jgi:hypothetical protein